MQHPAEDRKTNEKPSSVDRALDLFAVAVEARGPIMLAELAERTGLSKSTAHRSLRLLVSRKLLRQESNRSYRLGSKAYALTTLSLEQLDYADEAQAGMDWLKTVTPEAIHFAALLGDVPVYVAKIEGARPYRMASRIGLPIPFHSTSIGKAVLANLPPAQLEARLTGSLPALTVHTITDPRRLRAQLVEIRNRGFAIDDEENKENIRCVGAPVFSASGDVVGGLSVEAPTFNMSLEKAQQLGPSVVRAATMISTALGAPARPIH